MNLHDLVAEYEQVALKLGGALRTALPENQPDWLVYRDEVVAEAEARLTELRAEFDRVAGSARSP